MRLLGWGPHYEIRGFLGKGRERITRITLVFDHKTPSINYDIEGRYPPDAQRSDVIVIGFRDSSNMTYTNLYFFYSISIVCPQVLFTITESQEKQLLLIVFLFDFSKTVLPGISSSH